MIRRLWTADASLAARREARRLEIAMAAMTPMIATPISSSMSEKPFCRTARVASGRRPPSGLPGYELRIRRMWVCFLPRRNEEAGAGPFGTPPPPGCRVALSALVADGGAARGAGDAA